jgi:hypothetical protein
MVEEINESKELSAVDMACSAILMETGSGFGQCGPRTASGRRGKLSIDNLGYFHQHFQLRALRISAKSASL